ncbi:hypothetical protein SQ03_28535 [Methylobacterium platani JCM 14648]|uniref:DUF1499 domain-containing protein n=2 Tax=Methylobacterium platani TaxID=427683 RepID=A0A179S5A3_9HYPH|nr:hypothetical protein SQ03_28535 [Methylobacterium platani JCM 14648]OAS21024.1 hypothetical protein A5481_21905 [Methylobacterium platani]
MAACLLLGLVLAALAAGAVAVARGEEPGGIEEVWTALFGPPDLGPVDFAALARVPSRNDALACAPDVCPLARADAVPPDFAVAGARLREIVRAVAERQPRTALVFTDAWGEQDRYVARTAWLRCPDTVTVEIVGRGEGRSSLALYIRSQVGCPVPATSRARLDRWLAAIARAAATEANEG